MERIMFGINLEKLIKEKGWSIRQFAKRIGVSPKTCQEWCGKEGRFPNSPDILKDIADVFEVSIHELLFGEPDPREMIGAILDKTEIHTGLYEITIKKVKEKKRGLK
ncbi:MAG: helix-turn-helix transcriptional regulator [Bdellovibrionales bacterium]|nr:helix-turn-helix transcriptional regulator [Bdellovibrionales bacterium]